ncbi:polysaccharide deacetylase family protein [Planomicrobium sp. CPCC 101079]|uniref:polysaccharide deacetylase family protein n=1 Tax=Planomicrobium sp. CPCC 101079 TaxID=2599618 RepID=UPI0011B466AE|nr:polysaccharide deacetylase family protein [Planomicrobium sp. CPCC 101079]TWT04769.1 polysaccharide deacetylase family protein [Planomicrobium sp. CPCC 101079]
MIHMKIFMAAASLALLTACSSDAQSAEEPAESVEQQETEAAAEKEKVEKEAAEKAEREKAEAEAEAKAKAEAEKPEYKLNPAFWGFEPVNGASEEAVLITIDDAPDKRSLEMAETLKEKGIPAIFFVNGHFLDTDEEKETLKKIHDMGFAIGNHTETHAILPTISEEQQREEILAVSKTIEETIGEKPKFFRAPQGANTDFSRELVAEEGMLLMNWTYGYDWEQQYMDAAALTDIMVNSEFLQNGANLLMHDREWTAEALPDIIDGLSKKGYSFIDPSKIEGVE